MTTDFARPPSTDFLALIPHEFARRHLVLSAGAASHAGHTIEQLLVSEQTRPAAAYNVGVQLRRPVIAQLRPADELAAAIDRWYASSAPDQRGNQHTGEATIVVVEAPGDVEADMNAAVREAEQDLLTTAGKSPAVRLVDLILFEALLKDASDVHIQPLRDRTLVRYRLDGSLHTARELRGGGSGSGGSGGGGVAGALVSRIKVMASLDVAEHRTPQDGRASVSIGSARSMSPSSAPSLLSGRRVDLRISTLPSTYGERVVIRLLDPSRSPHLKSFSALGMPPEVERKYLDQVSRTSGIVLSTGPTGSGKTTTLYTTLAWLHSMNTGADTAPGGAVSGSDASVPLSSRPNSHFTSPISPPSSQSPTPIRSSPRSLSSCTLNMMTIEDPVEYDLAGALTASGGTLAISQTQVDPRKNVTFVTGLRHILRQDPDVIMVGEVRDEETARIAVQASLTGHLVLSTLHTSDAASAVARLLDLGVEPFLVASSLSAVLAQRLVRTLHAACSGGGCPTCLGSGYKGRMGVFELLVMDHAIRELVGRRASAVQIKEAARRAGMNTLAGCGSSLVEARLTTMQEVLRVIDMTEEIAA